MERLIYQELSAWKNSKNRKPLILRGVRQCGKTYCLKTFGEEAFSKTHYLNFEEQLGLHIIFKKDLKPQRIIDELGFYLDESIDVEHDFVIFDEIQSCPAALTSLKYFCEEMPQLALASAGSLLGIHLSSESFPVGKVDLLHLYPLSFCEFLQTLDDQKSVDHIMECFAHHEIPSIVHQHLWERLKWYFVTGGLPEVVNAFRKEDNVVKAFELARNKQKELIFAYYSDVAKYAGKVNTLHIDRIWNSAAMQLAQTQDNGANKFKFKGVVSGIDRYHRLANAIDWLIAAELVIRVPIVSHVEQPLKAFTEDSKFKMYLFDVGILGAMMDLKPKVILDYDYGTYKGYFAKNFVAQAMQLKHNDGLYCWQYQRQEIKFLMSHDDQGIIPIEVKSGSITKAQSLKNYTQKYQPTKSILFSAKEPYSDQQLKLDYLPLYLAELI